MFFNRRYCAFRSGHSNTTFSCLACSAPIRSCDFGATTSSGRLYGGFVSHRGCICFCFSLYARLPARLHSMRRPITSRIPLTRARSIQIAGGLYFPLFGRVGVMQVCVAPDCNVPDYAGSTLVTQSVCRPIGASRRPLWMSKQIGNSPYQRPECLPRRSYHKSRAVALCQRQPTPCQQRTLTYIPRGGRVHLC